MKNYNLHPDWENYPIMIVFAENDGKDLSDGSINFEQFVNNLFRALESMIFWEFEQPLPDAMRTYCHIAMVDPMLVEAYLGTRFDDIDFQPLIDRVNIKTIRG